MDCSKKIRSIFKGLKNWLLYFVSWVLLLLSLPFIFIILIPLAVYKFAVNQIVKHFHPNWTPLSGLDISFAVTLNVHAYEGKILTNLGLAFLVDADVPIDEVREQFSEIILKNSDYDRHCKLPIKFLGHYYWSEDIKIDIEKVIHERPKAENTDIKTFMSVWLNKGYEPGMPLWEIIKYSDNQDYKGKCIIAYKQAHILGDGFSVTNVIAKLFKSNALDFITATKLPSEIQAKLKKKSWISGIDIVNLIIKGPKLYIFDFVIQLVTHSDIFTNLKTVSEISSYFGSHKAEPIRQIRRAVGCKFDDVLRSVYGKMLRSYLLESYKEMDLPEYIPFISSKFVPGRQRIMRNYFTSSISWIPLRHADKIGPTEGPDTQFVQDLLVYFMSHSLYFVPTFFLPTMTERHGPTVTCGMTTFPDAIGSDYIFGKYYVEPIYIVAGLQYKQMCFMGGTVTTGDRLDLSIWGNKVLFPDQSAINKLVKYFHENVESLLEDIQKKSANENSLMNL